MQQLRFRTKLRLIFFVVFIGTAIMGVFGVTRLSAIGDVSREINESHLVAIAHLADVRANFLGTRLLTTSELLTAADGGSAAIVAKNKELIDTMWEAWRAYEATISSPEARVSAAEAKRAIEAYLAERQNIESMWMAGKLNEARARAIEIAPVATPAMDAMASMSKHETSEAGTMVATATSMYETSRVWIFGLLVVFLLGSVALSEVMGRTMSRPLAEIAEVADRVAQGDVSLSVTYTGTDELGEVATAFRRSVESMRGLTRQLKAVTDATAAGRLDVAADSSGFSGIYVEVLAGVNQLVKNVAEPLKFVSQSASTLSSQAAQLTTVSNEMGQNARQTSEQAGVASAASEEVSRTAQAVAAAVDQMNVSIREIAKHAGEAAKVASTAVTVAESTNSSIAKLGESSVEIGKVIKVITTIAQQTNLLALNATIEAARAGEAGKGFAVVANEVKELAKETAKATEDISRKIEAIQTDTGQAIDAIGQVSSIIQKINDISTTIAGAVEEQSATSADIGRNVNESARGSAEIAANVSGVATSAENAMNGATQTLDSAHALATLSGELQKMMSRFTH